MRLRDLSNPADTPDSSLNYSTPGQGVYARLKRPKEADLMASLNYSTPGQGVYD